MELNGIHTAVIGMGRTGIAAAHFLLRRGADVTCFDQRHRSSIHGIDELLPGIKIVDNWDGTDIDDFELLVMSPGVPMSLKAVESAKSKGIDVISEIELAYRFTKKRIIGITGTNGKSTTVTLLGKILNNGGMNIGIGGNLGIPFVQLAEIDDNYALYLLELSSYQLEGIVNFRPWIAGLLNITDDHLIRYKNINEYARAKFGIFMNQSANDYAVINSQDKHTAKGKSGIKARLYQFAINKKIRRGAYYKNSRIIYVDGSGNETAFAIKNPRLAGTHNIQNTMMCIIISKLLDIPNAVIQTTINDFHGLEHRIEFVTTIDGVEYCDDSKATNVDAVAAALKIFLKPVILIMGGRDKRGDYSPLLPHVKNKVKLLIVLGEAGKQIAEVFHEIVKVEFADSIQSAVAAAHRSARQGDVVLLSPACSSFDMFTDYTERGDAFKSAVMKIKRSSSNEGL